VRALAKLEQVLPRRLRRRVEALQSVSVQLRDAGPTVDAAVLAILASACRDGELLRFDYSSRDGAVSRRTVEPYRLVHTSRRWYLLAYDTERQDWRTFRVDRIAPKPLPGPRFTPRPLPSDDVAAYVSQSLSTEVYRYRARVTVHAPAKEVGQRISALGGRLEALGADRCMLHTGADSLEGLAFHLGYLGFDFEVHEPPELAEHLRQLSGRLARAAR
jgi:predicted DNA-binding transcriptional regulator YafY